MMLTVQGAGRITQMSYFSLSLVKRLPNTWELYCGAARRTPLPRTPVNKDNSPRLAQCGGLLYSRGVQPAREDPSKGEGDVRGPSRAPRSRRPYLGLPSHRGGKPCLARALANLLPSDTALTRWRS